MWPGGHLWSTRFRTVKAESFLELILPVSSPATFFNVINCLIFGSFEKIWAFFLDFVDTHFLIQNLVHNIRWMKDKEKQVFCFAENVWSSSTRSRNLFAIGFIENLGHVIKIYFETIDIFVFNTTGRKRIVRIKKFPKKIAPRRFFKIECCFFEWTVYDLTVLETEEWLFDTSNVKSPKSK